METNEFYSPQQIDYKSIVPAYQEAFSGWPWYEVSKCADERNLQRCEGGLSKVALNELCATCLQAPSKEAYEPEELIDRFTELAETRPTMWYLETFEQQTAVAALAWKASPEQIGKEKYESQPEMIEWMQSQVGVNDIAWLDEIFADKKVRPRGNLQNFSKIARGFMDALECDTLAFRTINPALVRASERDFGGDLLIRERKVDVPDTRDFLIINKEGK